MKAMIVIALLILGPIIAILLGGCASSSTLHGSGVDAAPPYGYTKLCAEHPTLPECHR